MEYNSKLGMLNTLRLAVISPDDQAWVTQDWYPRSIERYEYNRREINESSIKLVLI